MPNGYDILIVGGGINGVGIAADAAQRGLSVYLCEKGDFASATSSASSKLIHGGLRYLEQYNFKLVREALIERQRLLKLAPHIIQPMEFIAPYIKGMRPEWIMRLGLFIYDHLYFNNQFPHTRKLSPSNAPNYFSCLAPQIPCAFRYYDCNVQDSRLVILNAIAAHRHGAKLSSHTELIKAIRYPNYWQVTLKDKHNKNYVVTAKCLVNAAGPWVEQLLSRLNIPTNYSLALVKGSHIIVPQLYEGTHAYTLQHTDNRVIFAIPYYFNTTLIGTTDIKFSGDLANYTITEEEKNYLCDAINRYFSKKITPTDILHSYSGVRPLLADNNSNPSTISREYKFDLETSQAPILSIFGGKLTTYRKLAENALNLLAPYFPHLQASTTATTPLPGADFARSQIQFHSEFKQSYPWLDNTIHQRFMHSYGTLATRILTNCQQVSDLGKDFGAGLYQREVDYLLEHEWATTADDILWRRTKLGLALTPTQKVILQDYIAQVQK